MRRMSPIASKPASSQPGLKRVLTLPWLLAYGLGTTIGAGIYVLVGKVAGIAGTQGHYAFLLAAVAVSLPALAYAEFVGRAPSAAGSARFVAVGFRRQWPGTLTGLAVAFAGLTSSATLALGAAGYLARWLALPEAALVIALVTVLTGIAIIGIRESVLAAGIITLLEVGGLVWIITAALLQRPDDMAAALAHPPPMTTQEAARVLSASLLAFFAFIGFEDMVTVAEETRRPGPTIARAIMLTIVLTAIIYLGVYAAAIGTVTPEALSASREPLARVARELAGVPADAIAAIASFAVINGILIQIIMASRIFYGLARTGALPALLAWVHPRFHTPLPAIVLSGAVILALALAVPLTALADVTARIVLGVYALVCAALLWVKYRGDPLPQGAYHAPAPAVAGGLIVCLLLLFAA